MKLDPQYFQDLRPGSFIIKSGIKQPKIVQMPDCFLGEKTTLKPASWQKLLKAQINTHYYESNPTQMQNTTQSMLPLPGQSLVNLERRIDELRSSEPFQTFPERKEKG